MSSSTFHGLYDGLQQVQNLLEYNCIKEKKRIHFFSRFERSEVTFHSFCLCTVLFTIKIDQIFDYNVVDQYRRIQLHFAFVHGQFVVVKKLE